MILKRLKVNNANGEVESTWMLTQEQFMLLLNYSIDSLLSKGLISTIDVSEEELEELQKQAENEAAQELLSKLDKNLIGQA